MHTVVHTPPPVPSQPVALPWQVNLAGNAVGHYATKDEAVAAATSLNEGTTDPPPTGVVKHPVALAVAAALTPPIFAPDPDDPAPLRRKR